MHCNLFQQRTVLCTNISLHATDVLNLETYVKNPQPRPEAAKKTIGKNNTNCFLRLVDTLRCDTIEHFHYVKYTFQNILIHDQNLYKEIWILQWRYAHIANFFFLIFREVTHSSQVHKLKLETVMLCTSCNFFIKKIFLHSAAIKLSILLTK